MPTEPNVAVSPQPVVGPKPSGAWRWSQVWRNVLFAHWRVPSAALESHLPQGVEIDEWQGAAWVSAVAFRLEQVRLRGLPPMPLVSSLLELNLRTYVRHRGESGIYFLSMHADNRAAMFFARRLTPLPYELARISYSQNSRHTPQSSRHTPCAVAESLVTLEFRSDVLRSKADGTRSVPATLGNTLFYASFQPAGNCNSAPPESLDAWLVERYRAFVPGRRGELFRMAIEHPPWQLQDVELTSTAPRLGDRWGLDLAREPDLAHYSPGLLAHVWPFGSLG